MKDKLLSWEEYKIKFPHKKLNIFKKHKVFSINTNNFLTYLILIIIAIGGIVASIFIDNVIAQSCLISTSTGLFASITIASILEIVNNRKTIDQETKEFNRFLYQLYIDAIELINSAAIKGTLIQRETRSRYIALYGSTSRYNDEKMSEIEAQVIQEYDDTNKINNIPSAKNGLNTVVFKVSKSVSKSLARVSAFRNTYPRESIEHGRTIATYEQKLQAWDRAIQSYIYRFAEPKVTYFENIARASVEFLQSDFIADNYIM